MSAVPPNPSGLSAKVNKKRKRQAEEAPKEDKAAPAKSTNNNTSEAAEGPQKKKKKNSKSKQKQQKQKEQDEDPKQQERKGGIDESIGKMDGRLLADHFVQKAKRHNKELTSVELSDLSVPGMLSRLTRSQVQSN
jgi:protein CMS1